MRADQLTLACPRDNKLIEKARRRTRKRADGRTEWIIPHLDTGLARVNYHHPHCYLIPDKHGESSANDEDEPETRGH